MSRGPRARLFVAVDAPAPVREQLAAWARRAAAGSEPDGVGRSLRLLDPDILHLTLSFLGDRPVQEISAIASTLSACASGVGELSVGAPLWLPRKRPRALAVEIRDDRGDLARLHADLTTAISEVSDWKPEPRRFMAHITVARTRGRVPPPQSRVGQGGPLPTTPQLRFTPESVTLFRSRLSPGGASYEALHTCGLEPSVP
jgi:RNA 2',3'-cyclic 3'-phosphodiesterase